MFRSLVAPTPIEGRNVPFLEDCPIQQSHIQICTSRLPCLTYFYLTNLDVPGQTRELG